MTIQYHADVEQGTDEWFELRRGILTASEMKLIITPTLKIADNDKAKTHLYELLAQRISGYVEPHYVGDEMLRGHEDEIYAKEKYRDTYGEITDCGFITNDRFGFKIGYSPDGLVGDDGLIEVKSRRQKYQVETILGREVPKDYIIQAQTGLMVSERKWMDFISYCGGLPMFTLRVFPDLKVQEAIFEAAYKFNKQMDTMYADYMAILNDKNARLIPTERTVIQDIDVGE